MIAKKIIIEERFTDIEVNKDRLFNLLVDVMYDDIVKEIRAGGEVKGLVLGASFADPSLPALKKKDANDECNCRS